MSCYLQFKGESLAEAIAEHEGEPFESVIEASQAASFFQEPGEVFHVVTKDGQILFSGMVTHDGVEEITPDALRGGKQLKPR